MFVNQPTDGVPKKTHLLILRCILEHMLKGRVGVDVLQTLISNLSIVYRSLQLLTAVLQVFRSMVRLCTVLQSISQQLTTLVTLATSSILSMLQYGLVVGMACGVVLIQLVIVSNDYNNIVLVLCLHFMLCYVIESIKYSANTNICYILNRII